MRVSITLFRRWRITWWRDDGIKIPAHVRNCTFVDNTVTNNPDAGINVGGGERC